MSLANLESTYRIEYLPDAREVLLHDLITDSELLSIPYAQFQAYNRAVFGPERAHDIDIAVCSFRKVMLSWSTARVGVQNEVINRTREFLSRAMSVATIEAELAGRESPGFDEGEWRNFLTNTAV